MLRIRIAKTLFPFVAVAVLGSVRYPGSKMKSGKFGGLNITQCEPKLPKVDVTFPQHDPIIIEEVTMSDGSKYVGVLHDGQRCGEGESWEKKGHYKGTWVNNVKCGNGVFKFSHGCTYEGQFANDLPNGHGKMTLRDGKVFEGEFVNGALKGQPRSLTFPWGRYEGDVLNNQPHGYGRKIFKSGELMEGDFCEGVASGQVKHVKKSGAVWEGHFVNNQLVSGRCTCTDGTIKEGTFVNGDMNGECTVYGPAGGFKYSGMFVNDVPHGFGTATLPGGIIVEGTFVNGRPHGILRSTLPNGVVADVEFVDGVPQKNVSSTLPDGGVATGTLTGVETGEIDGSVRIDYPDGIVAEATLTNRMMHGPIKITYPDGTVTVGLIKCNKNYGEWRTTKPDGTVTVKDHTPHWADRMKLWEQELRLIYWPRLKVAVKFGKDE